MQRDRVEQYFELARERYRIRERRLNGDPWPWTEMPVFQKYNLCNVHREHDKTTMWFAENVRSKVSGRKAIETATIFRWFNRIETMEIVKHLLLGEWKSLEAEILLEDVRPIVTGAYMIKTITGLDKLHGALQVIDEALPIIRGWEEPYPTTLHGMHQKLMEIPYMGGFMSYEVVSDLRWTDVLQNAPDIMSWANAGPGCVRGLSRLVNGVPSGTFTRNSQKSQEEMVEYMQVLLERAYEEKYWPQAWRPWEMREVEHWLCEYSKITGWLEDGKEPKRVYRKPDNVPVRA